MARVSWLDRQDREDRVSFNSNKREGNREQRSPTAAPPARPTYPRHKFGLSLQVQVWDQVCDLLIFLSYSAINIVID